MPVLSIFLQDLEVVRVASPASGLFTINGVVAVVGVVLLILISVTIGTSMDTEAQHHAADETADQVRQLNEKLKSLAELQRGIWADRRRLSDQQKSLKKETALRRRCLTCPFRSER